MRVVIGEDEALLREGLSLVLAQGGIEVAAIAGDAVTLVREVTEHQPDLVITDIRMPPGNADDGLQAALELRAARARPARSSCCPSTSSGSTPSSCSRVGPMASATC